MIKILLRNPFTRYLRYVLNAMVNSWAFADFSQGYMSQLIDCHFEPHTRVFDHVLIVASKVGSYSYVARNTEISRTQIGRFCSIGPGCRIGLGRHPTRGFVSTSPVFFSNGRTCGTSFVTSASFQEQAPVVIGNDVWLGANVLVADGVRIGNGAIVGAGAVVVGDVPDYAVYGGVPARLIRYRFEKSEIESLNQLEWWNRDEQWLRAHVTSFQDISHFLALEKLDCKPF
jgi:acetyltransferase-like isoleucine patch superfamily enzyme